MIIISVFIFLVFCHTDPDFPAPVVEKSLFPLLRYLILLEEEVVPSSHHCKVVMLLLFPRAGAEKEAKLLFAQGKGDGGRRGCKGFA